ncbi:hypothetical protein PVAP13_8KG030306 [Panicum virgatum]|uniref:Uncharacterized protein n=1 Tax=Panicum virgatum TaxID=38727 RepID=A0A8T0PDC8_PANVG|nr:hypothetical protein PVAP13_8KG030306 [Panicum virgatum]
MLAPFLPPTNGHCARRRHLSPLLLRRNNCKLVHFVDSGTTLHNYKAILSRN